VDVLYRHIALEIVKGVLGFLFRTFVASDQVDPLEDFIKVVIVFEQYKQLVTEGHGSTYHLATHQALQICPRFLVKSLTLTRAPG
jgi:hypothetical protein